MKTPIVLTEHGDVQVFSTVDELLQFAEPIDVKNGEYIVFDADGAPIELYLEQVESRAFFGLVVFEKERVCVRQSETKQTTQSELKRLLIEFLVRTGNMSAHRETESIEELINEARQRTQAQ